MKSSIVIVGSSNTDMVIKTSHLPALGETVLGGTFFMNAGGKGANQAVAAARLGGNVVFIAKTGDDIFGTQAVELFQSEGIDTSCIVTDHRHPSGVALITVDAHGENCIVVAPGANAALTASDLKHALPKLDDASIILMQLEIPVDTVSYVAAIAAERKIQLVLNPAPACKLPDRLLRHVSVITPNQKEAEMLTGVKVTNLATAEQAATFLNAKGIATVVITMGNQGALLLHEGNCKMITAPKVHAVDTTAAGDIFNGALVVALSENKSIEDAVRFACKAAAISVTRLGAQASAPYRNEVMQTTIR